MHPRRREIMCQETERKYPLTKQLIQTWYMRHVFKDLRGSWRCISFARKKTKKPYHSQAEMARSVNLQRASTRAAASRGTHLSAGGSDKSRWMYKTFSSLYSNSQRKSRTKETFAKLKNLVRSSSFDRDPVSTSSLAELIQFGPCSVDFDLDNVVINSTDSDLQTGAPPSRRSSDSFLSSCHCESSTALGSTASTRSPIQAVKQYRSKRSAFRAAKQALSGHGSSWGSRREDSAPTLSSGIGRSKYTHGMTKSTPTPQKQEKTVNRVLPTPENLSRSTSMTMDTSSSPWISPSPNWQENYDILTESLSMSSWTTSLQTDSSRHETKLRGEESGRRTVHVPDSHLDDPQDWYHDQKQQIKPGSRLAPPISSGDLQQRQASAINGALRTLSGKNFQEAIVDIILENDVHDLVDLEEFLQGYFRLNELYQDIIEQFFNDLSSDLVHPQVSRAPSVFAKLASANRKSIAIAKQAAARRSIDHI